MGGIILKQTLLQKLLSGIFLFWCAFLALLNLWGLVTDARQSAGIWVLAVGGSLLACALVIGLSLLYAKLPRAWMQAAAVFLTVLCILRLAIRLFAPEQFSDFQTFYWATSDWMRRKEIFSSNYYFQIWSYQLGFPWLMSLICRLFPVYSVDLCLWIGAVCSAGNAVLLWHMGKKLTDGRGGCFAALTYCILTCTVSLSTVVTNQNLSMLFVLAGLDLLMTDETDIRRALGAGLLLALGNLARSDVIIYPAALLAAALVCIRPGELRLPKSRSRRVLLSCLSCAALYFLAGKGLDAAFRTVNPGGIGNHFPLYKFAVGLCQETQGRYSPRLAELLFSNPDCIADPALRDEMTKKIISESLSVGPGKLLSLMLQKCRSLWCAEGCDFEMCHSFTPDRGLSLGFVSFSGYTVSNALRHYDMLLRTGLFGLGAVSAHRQLRSGSSFTECIAMPAILAFSAISLVIEVQYRYSFVVMPMFCLLAGSELQKLSKKEAKS